MEALDRHEIAENIQTLEMALTTSLWLTDWTKTEAPAFVLQCKGSLSFRGLAREVGLSESYLNEVAVGRSKLGLPGLRKLLTYAKGKR